MKADEMTTRPSTPLRAALCGAAVMLAAWIWPTDNALACPSGGGTCPAAAETPASQPLGARLNVGAGNPINVMSGNKYQREEDMPALPGVLGLEIVRHYNSIHSGTDATPGALGRGWKLSYETRLQVASGGMQLQQADGSVTNFSRDILRPAIAVSSDLANGVIHVQRRNGADEYLWRWADGRELSFDRRGKLMQIKAATGEVLSLLYDAQGMLVKVTDPQGRSLRLSYLDRGTAKRADRFRGVQSLDSPVGRFTYEYGSSAPKGMAIDRRYLLANLTRVRHPDDSQVREYHYEDARHPTFLTGISVGGQRFATYGYNAAGKGVLSTHANDADKVTVDYDKPGLTTITNSLGQKTSYRYALLDEDYRLGEVRGAGCGLCGPSDRRYTYDRAGHLIETVELDKQGIPLQSAKTTVDSLGRPVQTTRVTFDAGKTPVSRTVARYEYADGASGRPTLVARPSVVPGKEAVTRTAYNASGQPVSVTEQGWSPSVEAGAAVPIERTTRYRYRMVAGRSVLVEIDGPLPNGKAGTPADSDVTRFDYDAGGSYVVRTVAPGNLVTEVRQRDAALRPVLTVSTDGVRQLAVEEQFAPSGQVVKRTESAWLLDDKGRPDAATRRVNTLENQYDDHGRLRMASTPGHSMTRFRYDAAGNLTQLLFADQSQTVRAFDSERQLTAETRYGPAGGAGVVQRYVDAGGAGPTLDARTGRIDQHWPDAAQPWSASYQLGQADSAAAGVVEEVTRPDGSKVKRWLDDFGRVVATRSPERGLQLARYDAADALVALRDALGTTISVERDAQGRALETRYVDAAGRPQQRMVFRYAGVALAQETRFEQGGVDSRIDWSSDVWGRASGKRLSVYGADGRAAAVMAVASAIDHQRQVFEKILPGGAKLAYHYDAVGNIARLELDGKVLLSDVRYALTLDGLRPVSFNYGNGLRSETRYGADGALISHVTGPDLLTMRRDAGTGAAWFERAPAPVVSAAKSASLWPWPLHGLIGSAQAAAPSSPAPQEVPPRVVYDSHGRLVGESRGGQTTLAVRYSPLGDRVGAVPAEVDAGGNVLAQGRLRLAYAATGDLQRVSAGTGAVLASYRYDAHGQRVAKQVGGEVRYFMYDDGQLLAEADATGRIVAEYIYLGRRPVARLRHGVAGSGGWLPGARPAPVLEYLHTDPRYAVEAVSGADGKVLWRGQLDAFGTLRAETGAQGTMPLRLSGQYADRETGLHYNVHRYYDPSAGRYLQADPLGLAAGLNMYAYAANDPLNKIDPLGLIVEPDNGWGGIVAPWLFGTFVHSKFALQVRTTFGPGWGANDQRNGTWDKLRPDAYYVAPGQPADFKGTLWELKPSTWSSGPAHDAGKKEVALYIENAQKGCWSAGSSKAVANKLKNDQIVMNGELWDISYVADKEDGTGLVFYNKTKARTKPQPQTVPAPVLTKQESDEFKRLMQDMRAQAAKESWSTLQTIGMVVLIAAAIALLIALAIIAAPVIAAIMASIAGAIAAAGSGAVTLMAALAAVFAFSPAVAAEAETKGKEKQTGMLDGAIGWFKSWF